MEFRLSVPCSEIKCCSSLPHWGEESNALETLAGRIHLINISKTWEKIVLGTIPSFLPSFPPSLFCLLQLHTAALDVRPKQPRLEALWRCTEFRIVHRDLKLSAARRLRSKMYALRYKVQCAPCPLLQTNNKIQLLLSAQCHINVWKGRPDGIHLINMGKILEIPEKTVFTTMLAGISATRRAVHTAH
ncbi:hypothetical protein DFH11DRAFT_1588287 [Phellopilus nigrolimitatus]|nr:hypothetical protein DFH11DRAFT_1588287 [Phellopilus nigrolimitatus]